MTRRSRVAPPDGALNVSNPLQDGQRSMNDVLVRITNKRTRGSVVEYASPGRAEYLLARYAPEKGAEYEVVRA